MDIYSAETIEYRDTETKEAYEERDVVFWFHVPKEWAEKWCKEYGYESLEKFDEEYIWDDSWNMYCSAKEDEVVIRVEEIENDIVYQFEKN